MNSMFQLFDCFCFYEISFFCWLSSNKLAELRYAEFRLFEFALYYEDIWQERDKPSLWSTVVLSFFVFLLERDVMHGVWYLRIEV